MGANGQNTALMEALEGNETLKLRGFTAACGPTGAVVVDRWNHVRGVWHFHADNYFWTDAGYSQPSFRTDTIEHAIDHTMNVIAKA
ncbi:MAG: hypothetical protein ABL897_02900 [Hyphomicrobium sp.]